MLKDRLSVALLVFGSLACGGENAAVEPRTQSSSVSSEQEKLTSLEAALRTAEANPDAIPAQLEALKKASDYFQQAAWNHHSDPKMAARMEPVAQRVLKSADTCETKKHALRMFMSSGQHDSVAIDLASGPLQACISGEDFAWLTRLYVHNKRCDEQSKLAAALFGRAATNNEKVAVLDAVEACSTPFDRRQHFAFVPPEVMLDYESLKAHRNIQQARERLDETTKKLGERCEERCMTYFAENGVCMKGCGGRTRCVESCRLQGEQCNRDCRP